MRTLIVLSAALLLAACATPEQQAAQQQAQMANMIAVYGPACDRLGFTQKSDPWRNCIINLSTKADLQSYGLNAGYGGAWGPSYYWGGGFWGPGWGPGW